MAFFITTEIRGEVKVRKHLFKGRLEEEEQWVQEILLLLFGLKWKKVRPEGVLIKFSACSSLRFLSEDSKLPSNSRWVLPRKLTYSTIYVPTSSFSRYLFCDDGILGWLNGWGRDAIRRTEGGYHVLYRSLTHYIGNEARYWQYYCILFPVRPRKIENLQIVFRVQKMFSFFFSLACNGFKHFYTRSRYSKNVCYEILISPKGR